MSITEENEIRLLEDLDDVENLDEPNDAEADKPNAEEDGETKKAPAKRTFRPQPKLDAERLKGNRGLTALPDVFKDIQFRGRGYEMEDLNVLLKKYEYWCHRLFPKLPFDACVDKIEKLGSKKAVQTHVKLIRMDMVVDDTVPPLPALEGSQETEVNMKEDIFAPAAVSVNVEPEISEEQLERMRLNRERAQQRRQEMLLRNHNSNVMD